MKLEKIPINQVEEVDLDEMSMCRLFGGGQCSCSYAGIGGSSLSSNDSANNK